MENADAWLATELIRFRYEVVKVCTMATTKEVALNLPPRIRQLRILQQRRLMGLTAVEMQRKRTKEMMPSNSRHLLVYLNQARFLLFYRIYPLRVFALTRIIS